jgi:tetratricopeptide (TPR) repeat protein
LARHYNKQGRHEEAALHAEKASEKGRARLRSSLERVVAYYHLERFEEGIALLDRISYPLERKSLVFYWKARFCERLGRDSEAEEHFRYANSLFERADFMTGFAEFLAKRERWPEADEWIHRALLLSPDDTTALRLRVDSRRRHGTGGGRGSARTSASADGGSTGWIGRAAHALGFGNSAGARRP